MEKDFELKDSLILNEYKNYLYFSLPFLLSLLQAFYTFNSFSQIRYEELGEAIRNVYWLQQGLIYDGGSSNVGWYSLLLIIYNLFGFDLYTPKYLRLFLHFLSLLSLAYLLKKYFTLKNAFILIFTIALSPSILFFNTLQVQYGLDLQLLPIILALISLLSPINNIKNHANLSLISILTILAWSAYPTFIFYLPLIFIFYLYQLKVNIKNIFKKYLFLQTSLIFFITPLIIIFLSLNNPKTLLADPIDGKGIFRAGGTLTLDFNLFLKSSQGLLSDLTLIPKSYYFETNFGEFSLLLPLLTLLTVFTISIYLIKNNYPIKTLIALILTLMFLNFILSSFAIDHSNNPGLRRYTPLIAGFYFLFSISYFYISKTNFKNLNYKKILITILLILPLHHLIVYPLNISALYNPSKYEYQLWFKITPSPQESFHLFTNSLQTQDLKLSCKDKDNNDSFCRYNELYAALAGYCSWNNLNCKKIYGFDSKTNQFIPLESKLWHTYYWEH